MLGDAQLCAAMFAHLDRVQPARPGGLLRVQEINAFGFEGHSLRPTAQTGIRKPAGLTSALPIRTIDTWCDAVPP